MGSHGRREFDLCVAITEIDWRRLGCNRGVGEALRNLSGSAQQGADYACARLLRIIAERRTVREPLDQGVPVRAYGKRRTDDECLKSGTIPLVRLVKGYKLRNSPDLALLCVQEDRVGVATAIADQDGRAILPSGLVSKRSPPVRCGDNTVEQSYPPLAQPSFAGDDMLRQGLAPVTDGGASLQVESGSQEAPVLRKRMCYRSTLRSST